VANNQVNTVYQEYEEQFQFHNILKNYSFFKSSDF